MFLLWGSVAASSLGLSLQFAFIPASVSVYVLIALGLRMGVLPLNVFFLGGTPITPRPGHIAAYGVCFGQFGAVDALGDNRCAPELAIAPDAPGIDRGPLRIAFAWLRASDELVGRPYWILGMASLGFAAAMRAHPAAVMAWGLALLLVGSLAFLASTRDWRLAAIGALGLIGITTLPFTAAQGGAALYTAPFNLIALGFLVPHAVLMLGFVRHGLRQSNTLEGVERWVWIIYPLGLVSLPLTQWLVSTLLLPDLPGTVIISLWPGIAVVLLAGGIYGASRVMPPVPVALFDALQYVFSFEWLFRLANGLFQFVARLYAVPVALLEGEAGLLWTLLFLALLFTLLTQLGIGA